MIDIAIDKYRIHILDSVLNILQSHKQTRRKSSESGGILLGQLSGDNIYIMKASTSSFYDKASRASFERDKRIAQGIIDYEFINSNRKTIYLGEWHTHAEKRPSPSGVDLQMIFDQFRENELNEPFLILIIQGQKGLFVGLVDRNEIKSVSISE